MRTIARHRSIVLFGAVTLVLPCSLRANLKSTVTRTKNPVDEIPHDVAKLVQWRKFSPSQSDFAPETATIDSHLSRWYGSPCSSLGAIYKGRQENERRIISKVPDTYTLVQKQENIMTQAAVDLAEGSGIFRKPVQASRKRKHSDDEEFSIEDDPSWEPRRKQRHTRHHSGNNSAARPSVHASGITVILTESSNEMWEHYRRLGTEMIICKEGRRMFPAVEISIDGLQPDHLYSVFISVQMKDQSRYRFNSTSGWQVISRDSKPIPDKKVRHADSKNTGSHFMRKPLSFKTVKMTNNFNTTRDDQLILVSMRQYYPTITIHCHNTGEDTAHPLTDCDFIAVTSYQKQEVTQLKIETNQFAAAFRKQNKTPPDQAARENSTAAESTQQSTSNNDRLSITPTEPHPNSCSQQSRTVNGLIKNSKPRSSKPLPTTKQSADSAPVHPPPDYSSDEEDDMLEIDDEFADIPPHIRPFYFQRLHQCPLSNIPCPSRFLHYSRPRLPPPPPPPPRSKPTTHSTSEDGLDHQMLWSSAILQPNNISSEVNSNDSEGFSLGLISEIF